MIGKKLSLPYRIRISLLLLGLCASALAQKFLPDTLHIDFQGDSLISMQLAAIPELQDLRNEHPCFISMTTTRRYLLLPVDREIHTEDTLTRALLSGIPEHTVKGTEYFLEMNRFEIVRKQNRLSSSLVLSADFRVFTGEEENRRQIGTLFYDYPHIPRSRKESYTEACELLLYRWHADFKLDIMTLQISGSGLSPDLTPNFIRDPDVRSLFLNTRVGGFVGLKWFGFQAEMHFSRPETSARDRYTTGIVRYINHPDYESFALGRRAAHYTLRTNSRWLLDMDANILMGFCKWKDIEVSEPELYQLFDISLSSVQSLAYAPLNRKGLTFRIGLMENFSYVIGKKPLFEIGLYGEVGVKF